MLFALTPAQRRLAVRWATSLCVGSAVLLPLAALSGTTVSPMSNLPSPIAIPAMRKDRSTNEFVIERNPFAGAEEASADAARTHVTQGTQIPGAPAFAEPGAGSAVLAVISGSRPLALIIDRGESRVLGVGDTIGDARIVAIRQSGVTLSNGHVLRFEAEAP